MSRLSAGLAAVRRPLRVPGWVLGLFAMSAVLGNAAQWEERGDLKTQNEMNNEEAECRSRIVGYVEGLTILSDIALGDGLLDRVGPQDDEEFQRAKERYEDAIARLDAARPYREQATEVCSRNPDFDVRDIPREG